MPKWFWLACLACVPLAAQDRTEWMRDARWGVMTHYLAEWIAPAAHGSVEQWNRTVDSFDAEALAEQLANAGAGYYLLTIGQNSGYYIAPNAAYDRIVGIRPSHCSRRDLVADVAAALAKRGIRMMVYLPSGAPARDEAAVAALQWKNGAFRNREFQQSWEQVIREWSLRWGAKISGWWFDGAYWPNTLYRSLEAPNFASFAGAARAGNPASALTFNRGVIYPILSMTEQEDYTAGEINEPDRVKVNPRRVDGGRLDGARLHMLSYLGETWGKGEPRFSSAQIIGWTRTINAAGGAVTWDVPIQTDGHLAPAFLPQLKALGQAMKSPSR
jgi:hypothetical protein